MYKLFIRGLLILILVLSSSISLVSCKSKKAVAVTKPLESKINSKKIIANYYNNKTDFSTLYIKSNIHFESEKQTQNVTAEIKIKKDEQILISIRFLGITMAKASITPTAVSYYEKMGGSYYEGDFSALSQFVGTDLNFNQIQNMLLGKAVDDLNKGQYQDSFADGLYKLDDTLNSDIKKSFYFDASNFLIKKQEISQTSKGRMAQVLFANRKDFSGMILPQTINIDTYHNQSKTEIDLEYSSITINDSLSFPYSVPNGYKRIIIK